MAMLYHARSRKAASQTEQKSQQVNEENPPKNITKKNRMWRTVRRSRRSWKACPILMWGRASRCWRYDDDSTDDDDDADDGDGHGGGGGGCANDEDDLAVVTIARWETAAGSNVWSTGKTNRCNRRNQQESRMSHSGNLCLLRQLWSHKWLLISGLMSLMSVFFWQNEEVPLNSIQSNDPFGMYLSFQQLW